jgi:hypothetical protein
MVSMILIAKSIARSSAVKIEALSGSQQRDTLPSLTAAAATFSSSLEPSVNILTCVGWSPIILLHTLIHFWGVSLLLPRSFSMYRKSAVCNCRGGRWKRESSYRVHIDLGIIELSLNPVSERWD